MTVKKISISDAKLFQSSSQHATFFSDPEILKKVYYSVDWWAYYHGKEILCVWPVVLDETQKPIKNYYFTYYIGPMWANNWPDFPVHKSLDISNKVYNAFLDAFNQNYARITSLFPAGLEDIRPFIWRNQIHPSEHHAIEIKYTAIIELTSLDLLLKDFRQVRRWELKNADLSGLEFMYDTFEITDILSFYNMNIPPQESRELAESNKILFNYLALDKSFGVRTISALEKSSGQTVGFAFIGVYNGTANIIINNVSKKYKENKSYLPTYLLYLIIKQFLGEGNNFLDFNGANSFKLADNKHSFGARAVPYFTINSRFATAQ